MEITAYLGFVFISAAQVATPGPSTAFLINNALTLGRHRALRVLTGDLLAIALLASFSIFGLAGLLQAYPKAFLTLRLLGAIYILWLGIVYLRAPDVQAATAKTTVSRTNDVKLWLQSFGVGISNPKAVLFFAALFPQFVPTNGGPSVLLLLVLTFVAVKLIVLGIYAVGAKRVGRLLQKPHHARWGRVVTGIVFLAFSGVMIWSALAN